MDPWKKYLAVYGPAAEAWHAFMLSSMAGWSRAAMIWMMLPFEVGQKIQADRDDAAPAAQRFEKLVRHALDAHKRAESFTSEAYASSLNAGCRSFQEMESAALDRGTVDLRLMEGSHPNTRRTGT